mgnify:CR=1 FL=1
MKPGDLVRNKNSESGELGTFVGMRTFKVSKHDKNPHAKDYTCAEVMWFNRSAPNGDRVSTIQADLIEVVNEEGRHSKV